MVTKVTDKTMVVGLIGLGRMGLGIAQRLMLAGHAVIGFDPQEQIRNDAQKIGVSTVDSIELVAKQARIIWLLVPAGSVVDNVIAQLANSLQKGDIIVDGGNSHYSDSIRRAQELEAKEIFFLDCGTSGGIAGAVNGFCLMVGGSKSAYEHIEPLLHAIAAQNGYAYIGRSGSGHYVKMVHNGIEYALLQAYAEGLQLIKEGSFKDDSLDLAQLTDLWNHGSVIRSWILQLTHEIFQEQSRNLETISGEIADNGTGRWTVEEAVQHAIPVPMIEQALSIRFSSHQTGGNYSTKLVALLRNKFGGHPVKKINKAE